MSLQELPQIANGSHEWFKGVADRLGASDLVASNSDRQDFVIPDLGGLVVATRFEAVEGLWDMVNAEVSGLPVQVQQRNPYASSLNPHDIRVHFPIARVSPDVIELPVMSAVCDLISDKEPDVAIISGENTYSGFMGSYYSGMHNDNTRLVETYPGSVLVAKDTNTRGGVRIEYIVNGRKQYLDIPYVGEKHILAILGTDYEHGGYAINDGPLLTRIRRNPANAINRKTITMQVQREPKTVRDVLPETV